MTDDKEMSEMVERRVSEDAQMTVVVLRPAGLDLWNEAEMDTGLQVDPRQRDTRYTGLSWAA